MSELTDFQVDVARLFFSLPASSGFLLAGGGALLASGLTTRPTQDHDFFAGPAHVDMEAARDQFGTAVTQRGWRCERVQDSESFVRLRLSGDDDELPINPSDVAALRAFFHHWADELRGPADKHG